MNTATKGSMWPEETYPDKIVSGSTMEQVDKIILD